MTAPMTAYLAYTLSRMLTGSGSRGLEWAVAVQVKR